MHLLDAIRMIFVKLADRLATQRRMSRFKCGDCDASERCGKLPSDDCIARIMQIERDGDKSSPRSLRSYQASF